MEDFKKLLDDIELLDSFTVMDIGEHCLPKPAIEYINLQTKDGNTIQLLSDGTWWYVRKGE